uniref:Uncharacterized protein n=1 Tax=Spironucleus salmonicida TaxID=348837 RepID=V6LXM8_9EUKA|eukprot:EST48471.1 hypothetical protein SS50377_11420 [Spironucleus salmonicida]
MLSTNSKPQIKRYNEISMVKQKKSVFIGLILLLATLIGVGVVVGSVFIAKHIRRVKIPTESLVDDNEYFGYRNAKKFLTAWSPSSNSIIAGQPAYRSLLTDPKQIQILSKFVEKHQFHSLFVYGGCVQWDSPSWVRSQIPYQESLRQFFGKFPGQKPGLMVYLNDISSNFTAYENVQYFGQALNTFNSKQLGTQKVSQVYIQLRPQDEGQTLLSLEAAYLLKRIVGETVEVLLNIHSQVVGQSIDSAFNVYDQLYISQLLVGEPKPVSVAKILGLARISVITFDSQINEFQQREAEVSLKASGVSTVWQMLDASGPAFEVREETVKNVQNIIQAVQTPTNSFGFSSYLEYFIACYGMEPIDSDEGFMIDLFLP